MTPGSIKREAAAEEGGVVDESLLAEIQSAFNSRDIDRIMAHFAEDAVFATATGPDPWGTRYQGRPAIRAFLTERFAPAPDISWAPLYRFACADRAVSCWVATGRDATGVEFCFHGCDIYTFRNRMIICKDAFWKGRVSPTVASTPSPG